FLAPDAAASAKLGEVPETTPGVTVGERLRQAVVDVLESCDGFIRREAIAASLTRDEKIEMLRGMILTRATDNRLKQFFTGGDVEHGILPAIAPLGSPALTIAGIAMAFSLRNENRVAVSFIGEGATSLGEWHEAINACAARKLPAIFCVQNNQTALSTAVSE